MIRSSSSSLKITSAVLAACATFSLAAPRAIAATETLPTNGVLSAQQPNKKKDVPPGATEKETRTGEEAAKSLEKNPKVKVLDPNKDEKTKALYAKLSAMANELGKASARPDIVYKVKIIDSDEVNAFTLPNGGVYFYRGLLDTLGSDDEIAAVMAHEIGHNACMHYIRGDAKAAKLGWIGLAAMLASLAGGKTGGDLAAFSQYAMVGVMNGYSVEYEKEADAVAVEMMRQTSYNPSALVTVMQRFDTEEKRRPQFDPGIFQTHPESDERAAAIEAQIIADGLEFKPRAVSGAPRATVVEGDGRILVKFKDITLMEFADAGSTPVAAPAPAKTTKAAEKTATATASAAPIVQTSAEVAPVAPIAAYSSPVKTRAEATAVALNKMLDDDLKLYEIKMQEVKSGDFSTVRLSARGTEIARVFPADAQLLNLAPDVIAQKWRANLRQIFWRETVNGTL